MLKISVKLDIQSARRAFSYMEKEVNKAAAVALNRVATTVRKEADQEIRTRLSLKSGTVKGNIYVTRPYGRDSLIRDVVASGGPIPLKEYSARQLKRGVTYRIGKGKPRKVYIRNKRKGFINPKWGGGHVFVATGPNPPGPQNAPVKKVWGPGISHAMAARFMRKLLESVVRVRWPIEFERQMKYRASRQ